MAGFFYYFPDVAIDEIAPRRVGRLNEGMLAEYGLSSQFRTCAKIVDQTVASDGAGPDGGSGTILHPKPLDGSFDLVGYDESRQKWYELTAPKKFWIGYDEKAVPDPNALAHFPEPTGYKIEDEQGQSWIAPIICSPDSLRESIDRAFSFGPDGQIVRKVPKQCSTLVNYADKCLRSLKGEEEVDIAEYTLMALAFLMFNYRLGIAETYALHEAGVVLFTEQAVFSIVGAAVDISMRNDLMPDTVKMRRA